jgi:hypothetical protein
LLQAACLAELLLPTTQQLYAECVQFLAAHFERVRDLGLSLLPAAVLADVLGHGDLAVPEQQVRAGGGARGEVGWGGGALLGPLGAGGRACLGCGAA